MGVLAGPLQMPEEGLYATRRWSEFGSADVVGGGRRRAERFMAAARRDSSSAGRAS